MRTLIVRFLVADEATSRRITSAHYRDVCWARDNDVTNNLQRRHIENRGGKNIYRRRGTRWLIHHYNPMYGSVFLREITDQHELITADADCIRRSVRWNYQAFEIVGEGRSNESAESEYENSEKIFHGLGEWMHRILYP